MVTSIGFAAIYLLGGLTLPPLLLGLILCHAYLTFPVHHPPAPAAFDTGTSKQDTSETEDAYNTPHASFPDEIRLRHHEPDVAAGYFAVCREYVPGGVNGKPPERTTPAGAVVAAESPSVYRSIYQGIFDRNRSQVPVIEGPRANGKAVKKARNVFYVVLRHGHLMLYDDSEQLEVRHVISLAHHDVDAYARGETIPEGELWIKRNCIRLTRKRAVGDMDTDSKPFFFFSDNSAEKEDFYHALLQNQERIPGAPDSPPMPLRFEQAHIVKLVQQLHASEENLQTRWINALAGRLFLAMYKTSDVERFVRTKITKKIARVPKPALINSIKLEKVDMGDSAPLITNPKLKELTVAGDLTIEADIKYQGNFRAEIAAVARIELGSRFKPREVNLILAGILKKLEGHVLIRVKPPPSNRLWFSFETMPKLEMSIEPIVSSRQITYGIILRAIESRIREVIGDTVVMPNWDDAPFYDTMLRRFRGGIWTDDTEVEPLPNHQTAVAEQGLVDQVDGHSDSDEANAPQSSVLRASNEKTMSMPSLHDTPPMRLKRRNAGKTTLSLDGSDESAVSSGAEALTTSGGSAIGKPKAMRSNSFAGAASPVLSTDPATVEAIKLEAKKGQQDAAAAIKNISARSQPTSPVESPVGSPPQPSLIEQAKKQSFSSTSSKTSKLSKDDRPTEEPSEAAPSRQEIEPESPRRLSTPSTTSTSLESTSTTSASTPTSTHKPLISARTLTSAERRQLLNQSLNSATAAAKKWGLGFVNRNANRTPSVSASSSAVSTLNLPTPASSRPAPAHTAEKEGEQLGSPAHPIGRGQPLPPPGTPLPPPPRPEKGGWVTSPLVNMPFAKRKPVAAAPPPPLPQRPGPAQSQSQLQSQEQKQPEAESKRPVPAPPVPVRRKRLSRDENGVQGAEGGGSGHDGVFVVEAPLGEESVPASPVEEREGGVVREVEAEGGKDGETVDGVEGVGDGDAASSGESRAAGEEDKGDTASLKMLEELDKR